MEQSVPSEQEYCLMMQGRLKASKLDLVLVILQLINERLES